MFGESPPKPTSLLGKAMYPIRILTHVRRPVELLCGHRSGLSAPTTTRGKSGSLSIPGRSSVAFSACLVQSHRFRATPTISMRSCTFRRTFELAARLFGMKWDRTVPDAVTLSEATESLSRDPGLSCPKNEKAAEPLFAARRLGSGMIRHRHLITKRCLLRPRAIAGRGSTWSSPGAPGGGDRG